MAVHSAETAGTGVSWRWSDGAVRAAAVGVAALGAAVALSPQRIDDGPVLCPFRLITGLPCPGCGLTRSWVHLAHADWAAGWVANPFGIVSMVAVAGFVAVVAVSALRRTAPPSVGRLLSSRLFLAVGLVWIAYGVARIAWILSG